MMSKVFGSVGIVIGVAVLLGGCTAEKSTTPTPASTKDIVSDATQYLPQAQERQNIKKQMAPTQGNEYVVDQSDYVNATTLTVNMEMSDLSDGEREGLLLMREEEKLAHDVYTTLYEKWNIKIFDNIAKSEQTHTDAIKTLLDQYGIADPVKTADIGVFTNSTLQGLYDDLVTQGNESLVTALTVGVTVEDLDIKDINELIAQTDNADILRVYENLVRGSRNHMRAFIKQLTNNGATYSAQYIPQAELEVIVAGSQERGKGAGGGQGQGKNGGGQGGRNR